MGIIKLSQSVASHFMILADEGGGGRVAKAKSGKERRKSRSFHCAARPRFYLLIALFRAECIA